MTFKEEKCVNRNEIIKLVKSNIPNSDLDEKSSSD